MHLVLRLGPTKFGPLDLRFRVGLFSVEVLELLDVHPAEFGTNGSEERKNLSVTELAGRVSQHEPAAVVVDEGHSSIARRENDCPSVGDHLQRERGRSRQLLHLGRQGFGLESRFNVDVHSSQTPVVCRNHVHAELGRRELHLGVLLGRAAWTSSRGWR